jgi:2'-5' RNA ligase
VKERLFIALWPPQQVVGEVAAALAPLQQHYPEIRWQPPRRWHVTVAFLGDRDVDREMERFMRGAVQEPAAVKVSGAGRFGPILWLGIETGGWLAALARTLQQTHHAHERRFRPHITVGRGRSPAGRRQVGRAAAELGGFASAPWMPTEYALVRSTIGPKPQYEVIARRTLADADR